MAGTTGRTGRGQGNIRQRGNSFQVSVFAGQDPVTGKQSYLRGTAKTEREAERLRVKLLAQVQTQRSASTRATLGYVLDAWLENHEGEQTTLDSYRGYIERTIRPSLGDVPVVNLTARMLETFYAQLRRCRARCNGKPYVEHRADGEHECRVVRHKRVRAHDCALTGCRIVECRPHECTPLSGSTVRQIHAVISGALNSAVRWEWIPSNPAAVAKKPRQAKPQPKPPTAQQAAKLVAAAWEQDDDWGMLVWLGMMTGARRGELLALRWTDVHWAPRIVEIRRSFTLRAGQAIEKDTKTHQMRRVALDETTFARLADHLQRAQDNAALVNVQLPDDAFVFSYEPDSSRPCNPDSVGHRYVKMCAGLGIKTHLHALRHYSATELITSGVDIRTVAGRLGHGGGGVTTLRVYAAWVAESDKRAADLLASRVIAPRRRLNSAAARPDVDLSPSSAG